MIRRAITTTFLLLGSASVLFAATATPDDPLPPPSFSVQRGFYDASFDVVLTTREPGALIRYTTDGSEPDDDHGEIYKDPIPITTTTPLRALTVTRDAVSPVVTHTYIFLAHVVRQPDDPEGYPDEFADDDGDGPYPADYEMDPDVVEDREYVDAFPGALRGIPTVSVVTDIDNLFDEDKGIYYNASEKGDDWERPISVEWLDPARNESFGLNAGARIHGQGSRQPYRSPKKSLRLYFRSEYGESKLDFPVFSTSSPTLANRDAARKFDLLLLRNGGNRSWPYFSSDQRADADYVNDEFARIAFRDMGHLAPHGGVYVHLYLNGLYWGLYDLTERVDGEFLTAYFGGVEEDYDLILPDEDAEPSYSPSAALGDMDAWEDLHELVDHGSLHDDVYDEVLQRVDVVNLADYIILTHYVANTDWPKHNWYAYRLRSGVDTRFRFIPWDNDTSLRSYDADITDLDEPGSPARLFFQLMSHPSFRAVVNERVAIHTSGTGALTSERCDARYRALTSLVDQAVIAESARWGDYSRDVYYMRSRADQALPAYLYTRNDFWIPVRDEKLDEYCPRRTRELLEQYEDHGWYTAGLLAPSFSHVGGAVPGGTAVELRNPNDDGELVYTTDGTDPRDASGGVAVGALMGDEEESITVHQITTLSARVRDDDRWSPMARATYYPPQDDSQVVINEIHFAPVAGPGGDARALEFIELHNKGPRTYHLDEAFFTRGISYTFPSGTALPAQGFLVLASDAASFQGAFGFAPDGVFGGQLSNEGETVELVNVAGDLIDRVTYGSIPPWPGSAAGAGASLELRDPELDTSVPSSWQSSFVMGGTPGAPNSTRVVTGSSSSSSASSTSAASLSCSCSSFSSSASGVLTSSSSSSQSATSAASTSAASSSSSASVISSSSAGSSSGALSLWASSSTACVSSSSGTAREDVSLSGSSHQASTGGGGGDDGVGTGGSRENPASRSCGCAAGDAPSWVMLLGALVLLRRRSARHMTDASAM
ncbi:MAG: CotH kinase family protein [Myxococcota bacterium]